MSEAGACLNAVILEDQHISKALIPGKVVHPVTVRRQKRLDLLRLEVGDPTLMVGAVDHHFVSADAVHEVVKALAAPSHRALDLERRKFVGNDAHAPVIGVGHHAPVPVGEHFGRCQLFVSGTEDTHAPVTPIGAPVREVRGALASFGRYYNPATNDWVFSQFRHLKNHHASASPNLAQRSRNES